VTFGDHEAHLPFIELEGLCAHAAELLWRMHDYNSSCTDYSAEEMEPESKETLLDFLNTILGSPVPEFIEAAGEWLVDSPQINDAIVQVREAELAILAEFPLPAFEFKSIDGQQRQLKYGALITWDGEQESTDKRSPDKDFKFSPLLGHILYRCWIPYLMTPSLPDGSDCRVEDSMVLMRVFDQVHTFTRIESDNQAKLRSALVAIIGVLNSGSEIEIGSATKPLKRENSGTMRDDLTDGEKAIVEVLQRKGRRLTRGQIADELDVDENTLAHPLRNLRRLGVITSQRRPPYGYGLPD